MRGRRHKLQVSTFPFLAVLLCAMGSLILVLLVMDRKAHKAAQARAQREAARLIEETARTEAARLAERERAQQQARKEWEQKRNALHEKLTHEQIELQLQMRKVREQLEEIAARLHYEQDTSTQLRRKVQDERSRLQTEEQLLRTLRSSAKQTEDQAKESSQALRRMTLDLLQMEQVLKDLKASRQREQKTFSVVPYHGRRGENRRPIYVECTGDGVIFHPERKAMPVSSLLPGPSDPSRDVRAEVERRIAQQRQKLAALPNNVDKTPYLLLLLRPSGVTTYHLLQRALRGLPLDFGYEFIDEDWVLDFPADDELPSTQPWMIATKTPARPADDASVATPPLPRTSARPVGGGAPTSPSGEAFARGIRGFRASETSGRGNWVQGGPNEPGPSRNGAGGGPRGTGAATMPGGGSFSGPQVPPENEEAGSQPTVSSSIGTGAGFGRGKANRHPSAMPPVFPSDQGGTEVSGDGSTAGGGYQGGGPFLVGKMNPGPRPGFGRPADGSPGDPESDLPGLGPPRALSSGPGEGSGEGHAGSGMGQGGIAGTGPTVNSVAGNGWGRGTREAASPNAAPGMGASGEGRYAIARGNNSDAPLQAFTSGGGVLAGNGTATPGAVGTGGSVSGTTIHYGPNVGEQGPGNPSFGVQTNTGASPTGQARVGTPREAAPGSGGALSSNSGQLPNLNGGPTSTNGAVMPGTPGNGAPRGQAVAATSMPANGSRSADVVIYVDPLTGKPTAAPRPAPSPDNETTERPSSEESDNNQRTPRLRVVPVTNASNGDSYAPGGNESSMRDRLAPPPVFTPPLRRLTAPRPAWVHGGRDWTIYVECRASEVVLYPSQQTFSLAQAISAPADNPLIKAIQQMIVRRQSSRRPGEPPYHPQVCLLVRPEHIRTFLTVYPALEALPVPKTRRNLDADDDVISIVTGAVP
jgi:hypothetical protein